MTWASKSLGTAVSHTGVFLKKQLWLWPVIATVLLSIDKVTDASIQRFDREVKMTCQLNHSNTIAIYDFGRTPEGVFYYAMEFLDGIDLQTLVKKYGPQPEARIIHILFPAHWSAGV